MTKKIMMFGEPLEEICFDGSQSVAGDVANFTVGVACLNSVIAQALGSTHDVKVQAISALGDDARSAKILKFLNDRHVDTSLVARIPGKVAGGYRTILTPKDRIFEFYDREDSAFRQLLEPAQRPMLDKALNEMDNDTTLVISGIGVSRALNITAFENLYRFVDEAKAKGATIVVDPNIRPAMWDKDKNVARERARAHLKPLLERADIIFITAPDDSETLYPHTAPADLAKELLHRGAKHVVVKRGEEGSTHYSNAHGKLDIEQFPVARLDKPVIDKSGAGDNCMAGALTALAHGSDMREALTIGNRAGGQIVQQIGAVLGTELPTVDMLNRDLALLKLKRNVNERT